MKRYRFVSCPLVGVAVLGLWTGAGRAQTLERAPVNPEFDEFVLASAAGARPLLTDDGRALGWTPAPMSVTHMIGRGRAGLASPTSYPTSYDLRTLGRVSPVRDQTYFGTCWSFSTFASLESCLLPTDALDFSEHHMVNLHGFDLDPNDGGHGYMAMAYLCRWQGPVYESEDPYPPGSTWTTSPAGLTARRHVQQVLLIPGRTSDTANDAIKQAIMDHGAVSTSFYYGDSYYDTTYKSYYYRRSNPPNHGVAIVGWDDSFSRTRFSSPQPSGDGAFIVKNSWGTGWGESGFFYVSYYDTKFARGDMFVYLNAESPDNYTGIYQYDPFGWVDSLSSPWAAALYTASASETLRAVGFYAAMAGTYDLSVYTGVTAGSPRSGTLACQMSGTVSAGGYHTLVLDTPAAVTSGQRFSIVLQLPATAENRYPQACEYADAYWACSGATAAADQTYYSFDGTLWTDLYTFDTTANFCLKGYSGPSLDYAVTTTDNAIAVTDVSGHGDALAVSEPTPGQIRFAAAGRVFRVNGGPPINGNSGALALDAVTGITVDAGAGDDTVAVGTFTGTLPALTIQGGAGADAASLLSGTTVTIHDPEGFTVQGSAVSTLLTLDCAGPVVQTAAFEGLGGLRNLGSGTLTLSLDNTYAGDTTVAAGTLALALDTSHNNVAASGSVVVEAGAALDVSGLSGGRFELAGGQTLRGDGAVAGTLGVAAGATVAPGSSPGILETGDVVFVSGSIFAVEIEGATVGTEYDQLKVTGTVVLGGATLALSGSHIPTAGERFVILNNDGADATSGTFAGLPEGARVTLNGVDLTIRYAGGDGNDVTLDGPTPTAARLAYFRAADAGEDQVELSWGTLVEVGTLGFLVERESADGQWVCITPRLIPALDWGPLPHRYGFADCAVAGPTGTRYRLVEVDLYGRPNVVAEADVASALRLAVARTGSGLRIEVRGRPGGTASIEFSTTVTGPWRRLGRAPLDADGVAAVALDVETAMPTRFYRVSSE